MDSSYKYTNHLIHESSPYLLQHAHNPVDWYPWGEEALKKAKAEDKPILVSIGYAACHWCHVMERESYENDSIAEIMNQNFVNIKVDREERPDIDQIYMDAVQMMTGSGGWPLNCFLTSDAKPFWGGTYFPPASWKQVLQSIADAYKNRRAEVDEQAERVTKGIHESELFKIQTSKEEFTMEDLKNYYQTFQKYFDTANGGTGMQPQFPMPNNYIFLLRYYHATKDESALNHTLLTLHKMAYGGIYDQIGGGFARYSTDNIWFLPHFEKMLYDNAQLVSLYSEAYQLLKDSQRSNAGEMKSLCKKVVYETMEYVKREMTSEEGGFFSSQDADSEGEEGKYYVWTLDELKKILGERAEIFITYFHASEKGNWEHGKNILFRNETDEEFARKNNISVEKLQSIIGESKNILLAERLKKVKPLKDDKILASWNALMLNAYVDAYRVFDNEDFFRSAVKNANFILTKMKNGEGLYHNYKNGKATIGGYLEDYAFTIEALLNLYQATFDEKWLSEAKRLADYCFKYFYSEENKMFYFTASNETKLISRKQEVYDNVIPSSNSSLAKSLYLLSLFYDDEKYFQTAKQMLNNVKSMMKNYPSGFSNWAVLLNEWKGPFYEIAIVGDSFLQKRKQMDAHYIPNKIFIGSSAESKLPLLENKFVNGKTIIYVCVDKVCKLPVTEVSDARGQIH